MDWLDLFIPSVSFFLCLIKFWRTSESHGFLLLYFFLILTFGKCLPNSMSRTLWKWSNADWVPGAVYISLQSTCAMASRNPCLFLVHTLDHVHFSFFHHWHAIYMKTKTGQWLAPGNPTLCRGVPVAPIQKSFRSSGRDWKPGKKLPIPCKFCTHRFIRYSSTCYGKVRIDPLMANIRNHASPVVNAAWLVVVLPC